ncbi:MAG: hypothetical protein J0H68_02405 [Sphingobacteriia bacterium]|nr:hypothetical protein [Sphingobacteriia bacterium]
MLVKSEILIDRAIEQTLIAPKKDALEFVKGLTGKNYENLKSPMHQLFLAILKDDIDKIKELIEADAKLITEYTFYPSDIHPLHIAAAWGSLKAIQVIVEKVPNTLGKVDKENNSLVNWAITSNDENIAVYSVMYPEEFINGLLEETKNLFSQRKLEKIQYFIASGLRVHYPNKSNVHGIHLAISQSNLDVLKYMLATEVVITSALCQKAFEQKDINVIKLLAAHFFMKQVSALPTKEHENKFNKLISDDVTFNSIIRYIFKVEGYLTTDNIGKHIKELKEIYNSFLEETKQFKKLDTEMKYLPFIQRIKFLNNFPNIENLPETLLEKSSDIANKVENLTSEFSELQSGFRLMLGESVVRKRSSVEVPSAKK